MGDNTNYYSHDLSFSGEEYNIVCESNIGVPGIFIFKMGKNQQYLFEHIFIFNIFSGSETEIFGLFPICVTVTIIQYGH